MTGKQRIIACLDGKMPDRVPLYIHAINEVTIKGIAKLMDYPTSLPQEDSVYEMNEQELMKLLEAFFTIHEYYGIDGLTTFDLLNEKLVDDEHVMDQFGVIYKKSVYGLPVPVGHPVQEVGDLDRYKAPVPTLQELRLLHAAVQHFQGTKALFWMMRGTFVRASRLMGMENLMINLFHNPPFVHRVCQLVTEYNLVKIELLKQSGLDVLIVEDDIADKNSTFISPEHFQEFINPYNRKLVEKAHNLGLKVIRHSDGNLWPIMDILIDTGYDGLNPLEPQAGMDLKKVKDYTKGRMCLLGNIDCQQLLSYGSKTDVYEAVRNAIEAAGKNGGLIICSSNSLHPGVKPENCIAMFEATKKYGLYQN
jgi:uroporphyrinogen decarboxylase